MMTAGSLLGTYRMPDSSLKLHSHLILKKMCFVVEKQKRDLPNVTQLVMGLEFKP